MSEKDAWVDHPTSPLERFKGVGKKLLIVIIVLSILALIVLSFLIFSPRTVNVEAKINCVSCLKATPAATVFSVLISNPLPPTGNGNDLVSVNVTDDTIAPGQLNLTSGASYVAWIFGESQGSLASECIANFSLPYAPNFFWSSTPVDVVTLSC
jgi:hypothetical protein